MNLRIRSHALVVLLLAALAAGGFAEGARRSRYSSSSSSDDYRILIRRNMFLRDRGNMEDSDMGPGPQATPTQATVLTGIVHQDGRYIAFVEDVRTNVTTQVRAGDELCDGRVSNITMDSMDYQPKGASTATHVEIGKNLEGADKASVAAAVAPATPPASEQAAAPAAAAVPGAAPAAPPLPPEVILERLRQNRLKEIGK